MGGLNYFFVSLPIDHTILLNANDAEESSQQDPNSTADHPATDTRACRFLQYKRASTPVQDASRFTLLLQVTLALTTDPLFHPTPGRGLRSARALCGQNVFGRLLGDTVSEMYS